MGIKPEDFVAMQKRLAPKSETELKKCPSCQSKNVVLHELTDIIMGPVSAYGSGFSHQ